VRGLRVGTLLLAACGNGNVGDFGARDASTGSSEVLFDDFTYDSRSDPAFLARWSVSDYGPAEPGIGAFAGDNITFLADPARAGNKLMRVALTTEGTVDTTRQGEVVGQRRFLRGTYASRMRFYNQPLEGPTQEVGPDTGDRVVCAFFAISPREVDEAEYGELDIQYLPNAGWNYEGTTFTGPTLWTTAWNGLDLHVTHPTARDLDATHVYWMTVSDEGISYHVDETRIVTHADLSYLPKSELAVMWNMWLDAEQFAVDQTGMSRTWAEDVDWFYHARDAVLTLPEIQAEVDKYRAMGLHEVDTLP
jgi:hypothetical protein